MKNLLLTVHQHGSDDVTCKPRIKNVGYNTCPVTPPNIHFPQKVLYTVPTQYILATNKIHDTYKGTATHIHFPTVSCKVHGTSSDIPLPKRIQGTSRAQYSPVTPP
jgi:hypothetical protein